MGMARCNSCNGVMTRHDLECYVCGEPLPKVAKPFWRGKGPFKSKPTAPVTPISNLLFVASLVLSGVGFVFHQKLPLPVTAVLSGILIAAKIVTDRKAAPRNDTPPSDSSRNIEIPAALLRRITLG